MSTTTAKHTEIAKVLKKALALLGPNGEHWIKGDGSRAADGRVLDGDSAERHLAVCWCSSGAIIHAEQPGHRHFSRSAAWKFFKRVLDYEIPKWNDDPERTFADVKAQFEKTIAKAEY